ncbi:hypothetical protein NDU88_003478 [Pleurodeles waltl]|uniref:Uncharacterized protein n=1 Tax=Pleurodeles waltl TaxID=8319 RepID=A0AAV7VG82_PLEWA|nr:hypothetical protein NDU88_003478 [Pleurodeles waltl]
MSNLECPHWTGEDSPTRYSWRTMGSDFPREEDWCWGIPWRRAEEDERKRRNQGRQGGAGRRPEVWRKAAWRKRKLREKTRDPTGRSWSHVRERGQRDEEKQASHGR